MLVRFEHLRKADIPMLLTFVPIVTSANVVQSPNAPHPISLARSGMLMPVRLSHL